MRADTQVVEVLFPFGTHLPLARLIDTQQNPNAILATQLDPLRLRLFAGRWRQFDRHRRLITRDDLAVDLYLGRHLTGDAFKINRKIL